MRISAMIGLGYALSIVQVAAMRAADTAALLRLDDKAPSLPLTASFEKVADSTGGPYVLSLKNISKDAIEVTVKIHLSVAFHANNKDRNVPAHVIDPDQVWTVSDLAAGDKITVTAAGFAPLELVVP